MTLNQGANSSESDEIRRAEIRASKAIDAWCQTVFGGVTYMEPRSLSWWRRIISDAFFIGFGYGLAVASLALLFIYLVGWGAP